MRDIAHQSGEMREYSISRPISEKWGEGLEYIPAGSTVGLEVRLESVHEGILVTADFSATAQGECSRCLTEFSEGVEVEFQELFAYAGDEATDFEVQDDHVDLETPVRDAIVLSLPFNPVCQPDCLGLDPVTGERLTAESDERASAAIDPRWAALQGLTDQANGTTGSESRNTEES